MNRNHSITPATSSRVDDDIWIEFLQGIINQPSVDSHIENSTYPQIVNSNSLEANNFVGFVTESNERKTSELLLQSKEGNSRSSFNSGSADNDDGDDPDFTVTADTNEIDDQVLFLSFFCDPLLPIRFLINKIKT